MSKQDHYSAGRYIETVNLSDISGYCKCGYITLNPTSDFEQHNGGLTVKRNQVKIIRDDGSEVIRLRATENNDIMSWYQCNACVNDWR